MTIQEEDASHSYTSDVNKYLLWILYYGSLVVVIAAVVVLLKFTPIGNLLFKYNELRQSAERIQHQVSLLENKLHARSEQLQDMKKVLLTGKKTGFPTDGSSDQQSSEKLASNIVSSPSTGERMLQSSIAIPANGKLVENLFSQTPDFPAFYPVEGIMTRGFNIDEGHYGIDIATKSGSPIRAIANGVIISEEWTFNYGYVIIIQHADGIVTVFKHARTVRRSTGQIVRPGDIIGTVGDVGILSTGPHLHFEIWKNGIPQNPAHYLMK